jgi:predicted nucleotidyltransferase
MESLNSIKEILIKHKHRLSDKYGLSRLAIFGSYARNEQHEHSDVDILVDFSKPIGIEFIDLAEELEQMLHIKVDLVSRRGIKEQYLRAIEKELEYV